MVSWRPSKFLAQRSYHFGNRSTHDHGFRHIHAFGAALDEALAQHDVPECERDAHDNGKDDKFVCGGVCTPIDLLVAK